MSASSPGDAFKNKLQGANSLIVVQIILGGGSENICVCILSNYFFCVFFFWGGGCVGERNWHLELTDFTL
jgi:hypothetical protein